MSSPNPYRWLFTERVGGATLVQFTCPCILDRGLIQLIGKQLVGLVETMGPRPRLVLNFSRVDHLSSAAVAMLTRVNQRIAAARGRLVVCGLRPQFAVLFSLTGIDRVLTVYRDEQDAILSFAA